MCLKEIQSWNKFTVCGGNQIPDLLGKHQLSELELRYTEPAKRTQGRTPASHWREEQIRVPRGEAWVPLWVGARGSIQRTRLCSIAVGLVMCSAAGGLHACRRWRHGPRYEGLHWRKSLVFILSKKTQRAFDDTLYQLSPKSARQACSAAPRQPQLWHGISHPLPCNKLLKNLTSWNHKHSLVHSFCESGMQVGSPGCLWLKVAIWSGLKGKCCKVAEGCVPKLTPVASQCEWSGFPQRG